MVRPLVAVLFFAGCSGNSASDSGSSDRTGASTDATTPTGGTTPSGAATGSLTTGAEDTSDAPLETPEHQDTTEPSTSCDEESPVTLYMSPDDSNSMSSPAQARLAILDDWDNLRNVPIRTHEFMNYYAFDYEAPEEGALAITPSLADNGDGTWTLQVGLTSAARRNADRAPMNLTVSFDTSGSMDGTPLDLAKETARALASSLREGDVVSLARWADDSDVLIRDHRVSGPDDRVLLAAIDDLETNGSTNLFGGLTTAYNLAEANRSPDRINRVILISDGGANVGVTEADLIGSYAGSNDEDGIYLVGVGVGSATSYHDTLMDTATDLGRGASVFIGEPEEAWKLFGDGGVVRTLDVAWRSVTLSLDLPPGFEIVRFSGEEVSTSPEEIEPQHLAPDDSMVFYMTLATCAPEQVSAESTIGVTAGYADPLTLEHTSGTVSATFGDLLAGDPRLLYKGAAVFSYAEGLAAWQQAGTDAERSNAVAVALERVERAMAADPDDEELEEIWTVLRVLE